MSFKLLNRVRMTLLSAPGTGPLPLNLAAPGSQTFSQAGMSVNDTTAYVIEDGTPLGTVWELGVGTLNTNGTLSRGTVIQTSDDNTSPINASDDAVVSATFLASDIGGPQTFEQLSDVTITSVSAGQVPSWNGTAWVNVTPGGGGDTELSELSDVSISSPTTGQGLLWNGAHWANSTLPSPGASALSSLTDVSLGTLADDDVLTYIAGAGKWEAKPAQGGGTTPTAPTIVQYGTVQTDITGDCDITLGAAPTVGNHLIAIGTGGGFSAFGDYTPGFSFVGADHQVITQVGLSNENSPCYGIRAVRSGDGATWQLGSMNSSSGAAFCGVLVEVAGLDISRFNDWMVSYGSIGDTSTTTVSALAATASLSLAYGGGANNTVTVTGMTATVNNTSNSTTLVFGHFTPSGKSAQVGLQTSSAVEYGGLIFNLPG